ncbi:MAG: OmpH family outer membrane protein [Sphingopyxis terrae]|nr:OmpH family outer membrane protein [Sphingopyxis terrae]
MQQNAPDQAPTERATARYGVLILLALSGTLAGTEVRAASVPASRVCVIDRIALVTNSVPAKERGNRFQHQRQAAQTASDAAFTTIESDNRMLASLKSSLPPNVAGAKEADIANRRLALQRKIEADNRALAMLNEQLKAEVLALAIPVIEDVGRQRGCSLVLPADGVVIIEQGVDLTREVMDRLEHLELAQPNVAKSGR